MTRNASLLLIMFVASFAAPAQTAKYRRAALRFDVAVMASQDSEGVLNNPVIKARMKKLLGRQYDSFMESFETVNPVTKERNFLFSSGCLIHACTHLESAIALDLVNQTIHAAIFRQDEKTRYFNEGVRATPAVIKNWAHNLRQIDGSPESKDSSAAPKVAIAQVETSPRKRLRSGTTVRGFIGGESHDRYVIHARKGQTLSLRLSWRREGDNRASFSLSESPDYPQAGEPIKFGAESDDGRGWVGRIRKSGDYYIDVVAHPSAHYALKVSVKGLPR